MTDRPFCFLANGTKKEDPAALARVVAQGLSLEELREEAESARIVSRFYSDAARTLEMEVRRRAEEE